MVVVRGVEQAAAHVHGICLKTGPPRKTGVELEWLVRDARDPALPVPAARIAQAVASFGPSDTGRPASTAPTEVLPTSAAPGILPSGAFLTAEPGGQLELSSLPADSLDDLIQSAATDLTALRAALDGHGLDLTGLGLDPFRPPRRILDLPRYAAMETFFDRDGPWGRQMMGGTASVQVCLDAGDDGDTWTGYRYRWRLLHTIGPLLVAAFANSPLREGHPTGWKSARQQIWANMDAGRTRPPLGENASDPRDGWARYALDAQVMCVRSPGNDWTAPPGLKFRDWIGARDGLRAPDMEDLAYHLSTLFPPVRPRGHFEIRMIDAQPGDGWIVPLAVTHALLADEQAADAAMSAAERIWPGPPGAWPADAGDGDGGPDRDDGNPWITGARCGLEDPVIAQASQDCLGAARAALTRLNAPPLVTAPVDAFLENYTQRGRCPADDLLEEVS